MIDYQNRCHVSSGGGGGGGGTQDICGLSNDPCRDKETWWWNEKDAEAAREKRMKYGNWKSENLSEAWKE